MNVCHIMINIDHLEDNHFKCGCGKIKTDWITILMLILFILFPIFCFYCCCRCFCCKKK